MDQFVPADWSGGNMGDAFAPTRAEDDGLVELLWCHGNVVMHSQPPRRERVAAREDEAAPWFQYPVVDDDGWLGEDLFSEILGETPADAERAAGTGTVSDSTPLRGGRTSESMSYHDALTTVTASSKRPTTPGKRKQSDTSESPSKVMQDVEKSDSAAQAVTMRGPTTAKRHRAAQEHNLSERRRRDRINEKMRALQELVPHCNKKDKASMLDEAIEYLKSLQVQVQMMWTTGGGMAPPPSPAMFPASGAHRYMQRMASMRSRMPPFRTCV